MEEKGKTVTIESDEEEEGSPTYIEEVNPEEDPVQLVQRPKYVSPSKGKAKVPTNLDEVNTICYTVICHHLSPSPLPSSCTLKASFRDL